jgi:hypothetical protein
MTTIRRGGRGFTLLLMAAAILALLSSRVEADELVVNGSFEDVIGHPPDPDRVPSIFEGPTELTGWTQTSPSNCGNEIWSYGFIMDPDTGDRLVELDAACNGILEQTIATTAGTTYTLSFAFAGRPDTPKSTNAVDVTVGSAVIHVPAIDLGTWHHYTYVFTANDSTTRLVFAASGKDDSLGSLLDSVSVSTGFDADASDCLNGGWQFIFNASGQTFKKQKDCQKFLAN